MKKMKWILPLLMAAAFLTGGAVWFLTSHVRVGTHFYSKTAAYLDVRGVDLGEYETLRELLPDCDLVWELPLSDGSWPLNSRRITVTRLSETDVVALDHLTALTEVDASSCTDYPQLLSLMQRRPEVDVLYRVELGGTVCDSRQTELTLTGADPSELNQKLSLLPRLTRVALVDTRADSAQLLALQAAYPQVRFSWDVELGGVRIPGGIRQLTLTGAETADELMTNLALMTDLEQVDLRQSALNEEEKRTLARKYPDVLFLWDMEVFGRTISTDVEEIDISEYALTGVEPVEEILDCFPNLNRVTMCKCGIDDETMDALNRRYEDIRFVWSVKIGNAYVRTDTKYFYPFLIRKDMVVDNDDVYPLRYCTDIECIDIGHMTQVENCEWAAFMPNLTYLVIIETRITDLTPLSGLKNLKFLEIFTTKITDYSPLVGCTGLEDLNLGLTYGDPTPLTQMTWLKNIWWYGVKGTVGLPASNAHIVLAEALPNTTLKFDLSDPNCDNGWRQLDNYYAMRDLMGVFYLT